VGTHYFESPGSALFERRAASLLHRKTEGILVNMLVKASGPFPCSKRESSLVKPACFCLEDRPFGGLFKPVIPFERVRFVVDCWTE
jgi:hypothetical protein